MAEAWYIFKIELGKVRQLGTSTQFKNTPQSFANRLTTRKQSFHRLPKVNESLKYGEKADLKICNHKTLTLIQALLCVQNQVHINVREPDSSGHISVSVVHCICRKQYGSLPSPNISYLSRY